MKISNLVKLLVFLAGTTLLMSSCASLEKAKVLQKEGKEDAALAMAEPFLEDDDPKIRLEAVNFIGDIGGKKAGKMLMPRLDDEDEKVKRAAVKNIGKMKYENASKKLVAMSVSTRGETFEEVCAAIRRIGDPALDLLVKRYNQAGEGKKKDYKKAMFEVGPSVAAAIAKSLAGKSYFENRHNFELLIAFQNPKVADWMLDEIENEEVADMVVEGLVKLGSKSVRPVMEKLRPLVGRDGFENLKERLIKVLGEVKASQAVSMLEELTKDSSERVISAAEFSLRKIRGF